MGVGEASGIGGDESVKARLKKAPLNHTPVRTASFDAACISTVAKNSILAKNLCRRKENQPHFPS